MRRPKKPVSPLIEGINLVMEPGEMLVLRGKNGSGKTTLARTLAALIQPLSGSVVIGQDDVHRLDAETRVQRITLAGQQAQHRIVASTLLADMTLGPAGKAPQNIRDTVLDALGLAEHVEKHPHDLSTSQQTLLSIANAFLTQPSLLILDEPTARCTLADIQRVILLLESYRSAGGSIICISHDQNFKNMQNVQETDLKEL